jgi:hypothetical protein
MRHKKTKLAIRGDWAVHTQTNYSDPANQTPMPDDPTLYDILQVSSKAELEIIEVAYKRLAFKYHPDRNPTAEATARMQSINAAYGVLKNPKLRINYDRMLAGLPPLEEYVQTAEYAYVDNIDNIDVEPSPESSQAYNYDWDDLPFATPKSRAVNPRRGWLQLKILLYRHRRQLLPYSIALLLVVWLIFILLSQPSSLETSANPSTTSKVKATMPLLPAAKFSDDFENKIQVAQDWTLETPWHLTTRTAASGNNSLWVGDEQRGQYASNLNVAATLNYPLDLTHSQNPTLVFKLNGQFDSETEPSGRDRLFVEVAEPGQNFQTIYSISSTFTSWQTTKIDLRLWKGKTILLRLRFQSGTPSLGYAGPFIDDIMLLT